MIKEEKIKNLLVSFSGGETSAFMAQWLNNHYEELGYENIVFVFANTGLENEQTLEFVERCDKHFRLNVQWIEADVKHGVRKGTGYYMTDFHNASIKGEPFESVIKKYGIPNMSHPHCTRELKQNPIKSFGKVWFNGEKYHTAIGIRGDEVDRMNSRAREMGFIYPLISSKMIPATKPMINFFWRSMPFRLELKGYQGNCVTCWKKSDKKLYQIAQENPKAYEFMAKMEREYPRVGFEFLEKKGRPYQVINDEYVRSRGNYVIGDKIHEPTGDYDDNHELIEIEITVTKVENKVWFPGDRTFFRGGRSANDILNESKDWDGVIKDDSDIYPDDYNESCDIFSNCGDL